jgi:hypothetical protein
MKESLTFKTPCSDRLQHNTDFFTRSGINFYPTIHPKCKKYKLKFMTLEAVEKVDGLKIIFKEEGIKWMVKLQKDDHKLHGL